MAFCSRALFRRRLTSLAKLSPNGTAGGKVGHRQALTKATSPSSDGLFAFAGFDVTYLKYDNTRPALVAAKANMSTANVKGAARPEAK